MLMLNSFIGKVGRIGRSVAVKGIWLLKNVGRYSAMAAACFCLSAALIITLARLDKEGKTAITVYAETASAIPKEEGTEKFRFAKTETDIDTREAFGLAEMNRKEGQILTGETVAKRVFALREARERRQENIAEAKKIQSMSETDGIPSESGIKAAQNMSEENVQNGSQSVSGENGSQSISEVKVAGRNRSGETIHQEDSQRGPRVEETEEDKSQQASSVISYSQKDYEVLKRIVEAEAGICDTKGRILVANVVINRVRSSEFPNTITGVVYQKSQFSPVYDGSLNSCTVTPETIEAVDRALAGEDYSQGALYFMNRSRSKSGNVSWFDRSLTFLFQHDRHEFFK